MRRLDRMGWGNALILLLLLLIWFLMGAGIKHLAYCAETPGLETRITFGGSPATTEVWKDMGGYKYKVWDSRPGPMKDESEYILRRSGERVKTEQGERGDVPEQQ